MYARETDGLREITRSVGCDRRLARHSFIGAFGNSGQ
jgi:hypothetical protein